MKNRVIAALLGLISIGLIVFSLSLRTVIADSKIDTNIDSTVTAQPVQDSPIPADVNVDTENNVGDCLTFDNARVIYLTFDDGPYMYTQRLLDILDEYDVKVTFFVTGNYSDYSYLINEEFNRGHAIGIHAYNHDLNTVYNDYLNDFLQMQELIKQQTGQEVKIFRFPGGSSNTIADEKIPQLIEQLSEDSYVFFDWDVDSNDATSAKSKEEVLNNLQQGVLDSKQYSVCLCHDVYDYTVDAIEEFIPWALENGFVFDRLNEQSPEVHHIINEVNG